MSLATMVMNYAEYRLERGNEVKIKKEIASLRNTFDFPAAKNKKWWIDVVLFLSNQSGQRIRITDVNYPLNGDPMGFGYYFEFLNAEREQKWKIIHAEFMKNSAHPVFLMRPQFIEI